MEENRSAGHFIMGTTQMFCLNDYLRDLQEVVDLDCGSSN